ASWTRWRSAWCRRSSSVASGCLTASATISTGSSSSERSPRQTSRTSSSSGADWCRRASRACRIPEWSNVVLVPRAPVRGGTQEEGHCAIHAPRDVEITEGGSMSMSELDTFLASWDREAANTVKLLQALPPTQYDFRPDPG